MNAFGCEAFILNFHQANSVLNHHSNLLTMEHHFCQITINNVLHLKVLTKLLSSTIEK